MNDPARQRKDMVERQIRGRGVRDARVLAAPMQFDEYVWFDETDAVDPLPLGEATEAEPEHPFAP